VDISYVIEYIRGTGSVSGAGGNPGDLLKVTLGSAS